MNTRTGDSSEVIEWMIEKGRPVLVASDVTPMPDTVEKLRRSFDAAGWSPDTDLLVEDKKLRASEYEYKYDNDHERDAVAAALEAYDDLSDRLKRVREKVPPRGFDEGEVVKRVLRDDESVEAVLKELEDDEESDEDDGGSQREPTEEERRIRQLEKRVGRLQSHVEELEDELDEKRERIKELEEEVTEARSETRHEVRKEREVKRLERKNRSLEKKLSRTEDEREELEEKLDRLKELWKLDHSDFAGVEG
ncbi:MAG: DUF460 domain-containing protein, partial [Halobacteria archaeon]|nr:DUF460 domain-containing protein [Halobacteria archaeon]